MILRESETRSMHINYIFLQRNNGQGKIGRLRKDGIEVKNNKVDALYF